MSKVEKLQKAAESLSDDQVEALISFAQSMRDKAFYDSAPADALASIERGLAQVGRGETISLDGLARRLSAAVKPAAK